MDEQEKIKQRRDRGGQAEIGIAEDGAIVEMYTLGGKVIAIKEHSIYEFFMADHIDPDRTNASMPNNIQKLVINEGAESELVACTFLTAKTLFAPEHFPDIDITKLIQLSLDLMIQLKDLKTEIESYLEKEKEVTDAYEKRRGQNVSYAIPAIGNAESRCTTIFQKADRAEQILIEMLLMFYAADDLRKQAHYPDFYEVLEKKYGSEHPFCKFVHGTIEFMNIVRELRNSLDHRTAFAQVRDFELQKEGNILTPTIELISIRKTKLKRTPLSNLLPVVLKNFLTISELTFAYVASLQGKPFLIPSEVRLIPEEKRRFKHMKYAFWSNLPGGWFHQ